MYIRISFLNMKTLYIAIVVVNLIAKYSYTLTPAETKEFVDFSNYKNPYFYKNRNVIVHLQDMLFTDIANECKHILAPNGYAAVQVSPVNEFHLNNDHPWYERMTLLSYNIGNASGSEEEFKQMVKTCNDNNVRVLVDVAFNNIALSNKKTSYQCPVCGDEYLSNTVFTNFYCVIDESDYKNNKTKVRTCRMNKIQGYDMLQVRKNGMLNWGIVDFLTRLIQIGVGGFRVLLADHMDPDELLLIYNSLPDLVVVPGKRPFIYHDVYDPLHDDSYVIKDKDYAVNTRVTDYSVALSLSKIFLEYVEVPSTGMKLEMYQNWGTADWKFRPKEDSVVFTHNFMTVAESVSSVTPYPRVQRRFLSSNDDKAFKLSTAFLLSHNAGIVLLTSTYKPTEKKGPKYVGSKIANFLLPGQDPRDVSAWHKLHWNGEHRWREIYGMVKFNNAMMKDGTFPEIQEYHTINGNPNLVYYCVGNKGFVFINLTGVYVPYVPVQTCFKYTGTYCDVIGGGVDNFGSCVGEYISVYNAYKTFLTVRSHVGIMAFHADAYQTSWRSRWRF